MKRRREGTTKNFEIKITANKAESNDLKILSENDPKTRAQTSITIFWNYTFTSVSLNTVTTTMSLTS